jgi:hypothetical protein
MVSVSQEGDAVKYASKRLQNDLDVILAVVSKNDNSSRYVFSSYCY